MSGGRGQGGYPGQGNGPREGNGDPGYDGDRGRTGPRRRGGGQRREADSVWGSDQDYDGPPGYGAPLGNSGPPGYGDQDYRGQGYSGQEYAGQGYDAQEYGGPGGINPGYNGQGYPNGQGRPGQAGQGYDPRGGDQPGGTPYLPREPGTGGYRSPGALGPQPGQPGQYGRGDQPAPGAGGPPQRPDTPTLYDMPRQSDQARQFDQGGTGPRRPAGGFDQRGPRPPSGPDSYDQGRSDPARQYVQARQPDQGGTGPRPPANGFDQRGPRPPSGPDGYDEGGYDDWEQGQSDSSFLPGFGSHDESDGDAGYGAERDTRYGDKKARNAPRGGKPGARDYAGDRGGASHPDLPGDPAGREPGPRGRGGGGRDDGDRTRKKATRWFPRILILAIAAVIVIGGSTGGLYVYHQYESRYHPADYTGPGTGDVTVQVMSGDTAFSLAPRLLQLDVIASTRAFINAAQAAASSTGLEAGYYQLHEHMQASIAYTDLLNPKNRVQTTVTIPEGKRAVDVIAILAAKTRIPLKDFQQVLAHPGQLGLPSYANGKVEGYLFPATYAIVPHETALEILQAMVQRFNAEAQQLNLVSAAQSAGLTPTQLIIEASLAQAEGGSVSDYPKIAEVIHNRLASGMHLQFDSTVLYGLGRYAVSATFKEIRTPGPYNTYMNAGLPAGPISNPGDAAIQGVLHLDHGNWLYFLTVPGGKSQFSATPLKGQ